MLKLSHCYLKVGKNSRMEKTILNDLSLKVDVGEFVLIIGDNGVGKSTLFKAISGELQLDEGKIEINNQDITKFDSKKRSPFISKVLQDSKVATMDNMTVEENLSFAYMRGQKRGLSFFHSKSRKSFFCEKLSLLNLGLEDKMSELSSSLSGGQRQALSLIMGIVRESKILLLDEITSALDPKTAELVIQLAYEIAKRENRTTLLITHNIGHIEKYGDRVLKLEDGFLSEIRV